MPAARAAALTTYTHPHLIMTLIRDRDRVCTHTAGAYVNYHAGSTSSRTHYVHPPVLNFDTNTRSHMHPHSGAYKYYMPAAEAATHTTYVHPPAHKYGRSRTQSHSCIRPATGACGWVTSYLRVLCSVSWAYYVCLTYRSVVKETLCGTQHRL